MSNGYVYLIKGNREGDITYKIGKSKNPNIRVKSVQTGNPDDLTVLFKIESDLPSKLETFLHRTFSPFIVRGEWFKSEKIEDRFEQECKNFEKMVSVLKTESTLSEKQLYNIL